MMEIDENTDLKKLKKQLFFSALKGKAILGIVRILFAVWDVVKFVLAPVALLVELLILVPLIYFTNKQDRDIRLEEIDMNALHDEVFEEIQEDIATFENHGFVEIKLVQGHLVDDKGTLFTQLMLNESNGIALALMYGVFKDAEGEYSNIQIAYQEFDFETSRGEKFEFHNARKESISMTNRVTRLYIEEYDPEILYRKVQDISQKLDIVVNKKTMQMIRNNPIQMMKESYHADMEYLLHTGFFKQKDNYLTPSLKASAISIFKEMWPVSGYLTKKSWKRTLEFLNNNDCDIEAKDYYSGTMMSAPLQKKIKTLSDINAFVTAYPLGKMNVESLEFYLDDDDEIERAILYLEYQKPIGRSKCIIADKQLDLNSAEGLYYDYGYAHVEIGDCSQRQYIKDFQNILAPKAIVDLITHKYPNVYIDTMKLTGTHYEVAVEIDEDGESSFRILHIDNVRGEFIIKK